MEWPRQPAELAGKQALVSLICNNNSNHRAESYTGYPVASSVTSVSSLRLNLGWREMHKWMETASA